MADLRTTFRTMLSPGVVRASGLSVSMMPTANTGLRDGDTWADNSFVRIYSGAAQDTLAETVADTIGAMLTGNTETGITVTYQDSDNTIDFVVDAEFISDTVGAMVTGNTESGITVTYQDSDNTIDFELDPDLVTIAGLTATTDNFMIAASSAWASRTPTQAKTSLGLATTTTDNAIVRFDSTGGNTQNSVATVADTTGAITAGAFRSADFVSIADDAVATFTLSNYMNSGRYGTLLLIDGDEAVNQGFIKIHSTATVTPTTIAGAFASVGYYNTVLAGTTGADAQINVGINSGTLYLENRRGGTRRYLVVFFG